MFPDLTAWLLAMGFVFGGGGTAIALVGAVQIIREERQVKRAAAASRGVVFDAATYPGRTLR